MIQENRPENQTDTEVSAETNEASPISLNDNENSSVFLIENPYNFPNALELNSDSSFSSEDADLEPELKLADFDTHEMNRIAEAVEEAEEKSIIEMSALAAEIESETETLLANQIAEDQAIEKELAEEDAAAAAEDLAPVLSSLDLDEAQACIETLLFLSDKPISTEKLRELLGPDLPLSLFQEAVTALKDEYQATRHGIELVQVGNGIQFRTKPGKADLAKKLAKVQSQRLSTGAMETLAIIAYKQPVLKDEVDKIRGVDSSHFIRGLMDKKIVFISGRSEAVGYPNLYSTTPEFLELFGLNSLQSMPSLRELEQMVPTSEVLRATTDTDPRILQMRKMINDMKMDGSALKFDPKEDEKNLKEIREKVQQIAVSTPYLEEQKRLEKEASDQIKIAASEAALAAGQLPLPPTAPTASAIINT